VNYGVLTKAWWPASVDTASRNDALRIDGIRLRRGSIRAVNVAIVPLALLIKPPIIPEAA